MIQVSVDLGGGDMEEKMAMSAEKCVVQHIASVPLIDHHVHCCLVDPPDCARFEQLICESAGTFAGGESRFDSQVGFALVRYCSPLLFGERCRISEYMSKRLMMDERTIDRLLLSASGVRSWIIDPGWNANDLVSLDEFASLSSGIVHRLVRLESVAEWAIAACEDVRGFVPTFRSELAKQSQGAVGFKTICAYRCGFDIDWREPDENQVTAAVAALSPDCRRRLADPVITSFIIHEAMKYAMPIQFHVGLGDRDVDLRHSSPLDLRPLLIETERLGVPVVLLHCWPFERECGYLCQNYTNVYMDVGLTMYLMGEQGIDALARAMSMCPFSRLMYSSDAWGLPELHLLGAKLFRDALSKLVGEWLSSRAWEFEDAIRVVDAVAFGNAARLYGISDDLIL